jgi:NadR type nicotinamide-nucleotide adenylyltransferase
MNPDSKLTKRIVVIGPESTGKTSLCQQLAERYNTRWVPEFARNYLLQHGTNYSYNDLLTIAHGQLEQEKIIEEALVADTRNQNRLLIIDTNMYVMQVWCEFVFQKCHSWILEQLAERPYDLYLLCNIDLPWVKDELREYPDLESRKSLYHMYRQILATQNVPWVHVTGNYEQRLQIASAAIDNL